MAPFILHNLFKSQESEDFQEYEPAAISVVKHESDCSSYSLNVRFHDNGQSQGAT